MCANFVVRVGTIIGWAGLHVHCLLASQPVFSKIEGFENDQNVPKLKVLKMIKIFQNFEGLEKNERRDRVECTADHAQGRNERAQRLRLFL